MNYALVLVLYLSDDFFNQFAICQLLTHALNHSLILRFLALVMTCNLSEIYYYFFIA
jgi:hypothetical protein